ncbi:hypothetical protein FPV67DRAFT_571087 [Lyophyllum atratum]|nr:hypothetical protein FPV67DRAFT_571087 [Lyophyllum atratum]
MRCSKQGDGDESIWLWDIVKNNMGLLLVTGSQAFLSLVNVAVKRLNSIDPPVSTFELIAVRMVCFLPTFFSDVSDRGRPPNPTSKIITYVCSMVYMIYAGVPDPWLGPRGVRLLLVFRGFSGFLVFSAYIIPCSIYHSRMRLF